MTGRVASPNRLSQAEPVSRLGPLGFDPARLRELAARLEVATGPSRELDREIQCRKGRRPIVMPGELTASVDEARLLLPLDALWAVGSMEEGPFARLCWPMPCGGYLGGYVEGHGTTAALSLCAAALRGEAIAMEAREGTDPKGLDGEAATARAEGIARKDAQ